MTNQVKNSADVKRLCKKLKKYSVDNKKNNKVLKILQQLKDCNMTLKILKKTQIGWTVNQVRKNSSDNEVKEHAKLLIKSWKRILDGKKQNEMKPRPEKVLEPEKALPPSSPSSSSPPASTSSSLSQQASISSTIKSSPSFHLSPSSSSSSTTTIVTLTTSTSSLSSSSLSLSSSSLLSSSSQLPQSSPSSSQLQQLTSSPKSSSSSSPVLPPISSSSSSSHIRPRNQQQDIDTDDPTRLGTRNLLAKALRTPDDDEDAVYSLASEIESCIYDELKETNVKYKNRIRSKIFNIKDPKNPQLKENILKGIISPEKIASMKPEEMASEEMKKLRDALTKKAINEAHAPVTVGAKSDLFRCSRCGKRDTTYNQVQTLSGDEPMTTFVVCNQCGHRWRFS